ncbi:hypothetical protein CAPTEDRAFT_195052 [Capitella teleta]|uniref:ERAP1-like C-terminal domain-containing protein n=1 Tax=Capitella teleta TaxID=283909 RepID=R7UHA2_CAPTE|nr:hypothetical protein CAPTEDRAFT_195052 [Capitella teleta]|eukprot:ELU05924.1 hypothetical protein CAPTEDRAFT_195052 [Capitella teleta]
MANENDPEAPMHTDIWMNQEPVVVDQLDLQDAEWLLVNPTTTGFKRVLYDQENMDNLLRQLLDNHLVIDVESRATLVENAFAFARVGLVKETDAMDTTVYLANELESLPWMSADYGMQKQLTTLLKRFPETYELLQAYLLQLVTPVYEHKGWEKESEEDVYQMMLREVAVTMACTCNNVDCVLTAQSLVEEWLSSETNPIFVDLRANAYCTAVRTGDETDWEAMFDKYLSTGPLHLPNATIERSDILFGLSCSTDEEVLSSYYDLMFDEDMIPRNEVPNALLPMARSDSGRWFLWQHFVSFWDVTPLPQGVNRRSVFMAVVEGFATEEDYASFDAFTLKFPAEDEEDEALYQSARDVIQKNLLWADANQQQLHDWLQDKARA